MRILTEQLFLCWILISLFNRTTCPLEAFIWILTTHIFSWLNFLHVLQQEPGIVWDDFNSESAPTWMRLENACQWLMLFDISTSWLVVQTRDRSWNSRVNWVLLSSGFRSKHGGLLIGCLLFFFPFFSLSSSTPFFLRRNSYSIYLKLSCHFYWKLVKRWGMKWNI